MVSRTDVKIVCFCIFDIYISENQKDFSENEKDVLILVLNILKKYHKENILDSCIRLYIVRKNPVILSVALSYVRYKYVGIKKRKEYNNLKDTLKNSLSFHFTKKNIK